MKNDFDIDPNITICTVSWCGNKCELYQKDMTGKLSYYVIQSLEENGKCPYRPYTVYGEYVKF